MWLIYGFMLHFSLSFNLGEHDTSPPSLQIKESTTCLEITPSSDCRKVTYYVLCLCLVEEVKHELGKLVKQAD